jgi:hypothetical protein
MKIERQRLFQQLQPPAGGLERLQRKIHNAALNRTGYRWQPVLAAAMLVLALGLSAYWLPQQQASEPVTEEVFNATEFDRLLGRSPAKVELLVSRDHEAVSIVEVPDTGANARVYRLNPRG